MTKKELVARVADESEVVEDDVRMMLDIILDVMTDEFLKGERVRLPVFGTFNVKETKTHTGFDPATGKKVIRPTTKRVTFKPWKSLKDRMNG